VSYAQALHAARSIGQALLDRGLSAERPVAILSENGLEHALLALGCLYAGVPYCPVSPPYSLVSQDYDKLRHVLDTLTPGLVFAGRRRALRPAIAATVPPTSRWCSAEGGSKAAPPPLRRAAGHPPRPPSTRPCGHRPRHHHQVPVHLGLDQAAQGGDQHPPHVVRQPAADAPVDARAGRRAAGAGRLAALEPHLRRQPQRGHRAGQRRHALHRRRQAHAGADGETLRNLREIAPTIYFNVPTGFEAIAHAMKADAVLRATCCRA
jgi:feruloyl-CoA synthase